MEKIAIIGAAGYVGENLSHNLTGYFSVIKFTHRHGQLLDRGNFNDESLYLNSEILTRVNEFSAIIFLAESTHKRTHEKIKTFLGEIIQESLKVKVIFLSTLSAYSKYQSRYVLYKKQLESIVLEYPNGFVIRPGVIFGGKPGGLYKKFANIRYKKIVFLPCYNSETGFVSMICLVRTIQQLIEFGNSKKLSYLFEIKLSLAHALNFFGFRGMVIGISANILKALFWPIIASGLYLPRTIESLLVLDSLDINLLAYQGNQKIFYKKILADFRRINNGERLKMNLRKFLREIAKSNSIFEYQNLDKSNLFLFHKKLSELYRLDSSQVT